MQKKKGISLIVLVITIVVMIIIAGTTISVMVGENSIINQAKKAKIESDLAQIKESSDLVKSTGLTEYYSGEKAKYDKEDLLNDLNNNFEGSLLSADRVTTADGQYDIIVDDNLNIVVVQSNGQGSLAVTPKVTKTADGPVVSLRFSVPGETMVVDYVLNYIDTKLYKNKSIAEMETEFLTLISEPTEDGTTPTMTDEIREEIFNYGKILGATTYEQTLKAMLLIMSMQSSENQYETFGTLGDIAYPYATKYIGLQEYTNQNDLKTQLVSVAEVDSFETYLTTEFDGATESDITTMLAENNVEYEDFLKFLILQEYATGLTDEEKAELLEPYMMEIKVSNGTTTETIPTLSLLGVHPYPVTENGVYTFELTTMDGKTTTTTVVVNEVTAVRNPYGENDWEYAFSYDGTALTEVTKGNTASGQVTVKFYKMDTTVSLPTSEEGEDTTNNAYTMVIEGQGSMGEETPTWQDYGAWSEYEGERFPMYVTKVIVCDGIEHIAPLSFFGFVNLKEIQLPESLTSIGMRAFSNCWSLTNIDNIMSRITVIEANTFEYCKGLPASLTIPNNITAIGDNAFTGCETLTEVTISTGVKTIDHDAFSNCDNLKNVKILSTQLTQIGKGTFCDLPTGSIITVPNETIKNLLVDDGTYNNTNYDSETTTIVVE